MMMSDSDLPTDILSLLSLRVDKELGIYLPQSKWGDLVRRLHPLESTYGKGRSRSDFLYHLCSDDWPVELRQALTNCLTIGETYFFRDPSLWQYLLTSGLPSLLRKAASSGQDLKLWSAACCTGEEPYTAAIIVDMLRTAYQNVRISIVGTDLNHDYLVKARSARYQSWSLRAARPEMVSTYFDVIPHGTGESYQLKPHIANMVKFEQLNMVSEHFDAYLGGGPVDVIFCRNVLMYFSEERQKSLMAKLTKRVANGGYLVVSPHDTALASVRDFERIILKGCVLLQKLTSSSPSAARFTSPLTPISPSRPAPPPVPVTQSPLPPPSPPRRPSLHEESREPTASPCGVADAYDPAEMKEKVDNLIKKKRWQDALTLVQDNLKVYSLDQSLHYAEGLIHEEIGDNESAVAALQKAIYLDSGFIMAHFALQSILRRLGRTSESSIHLRCAERLLRALHPLEPVPESEGLSAAQLLNLVTTVLNRTGK